MERAPIGVISNNLPNGRGGVALGLRSMTMFAGGMQLRELTIKLRRDRVTQHRYANNG